MSLPINHTVVHPSPTLNYNSDENAPFNLKWLAKHFNLNEEDVLKAKFDRSVREIFKIKFKPGKEAEAKEFYSDLKRRECSVRFHEYDNSINFFRKEKAMILAVCRTIFNTSLDDKNFAASNPEKNSLQSELEKTIPIPFKLDWLADNLGLDKQAVVKSKFNFFLMEFNITFDTRDNRNIFYQALKNIKAHAYKSKCYNKISISYEARSKILKHVDQSDIGLNRF